MKKLKFFGLLVALALLAFGLTVGCSNGSTDEEVETQSSVFTGKTATGQDVEITFSNVAFAKARAAGPYQNGFYLLKIDGVEKSRGRTRLDSNKDITFIPDGGGTEFHGELLNGVLEVSGTVDGVALNVRTTTEDSGTTPGGVGGGGGSGTGGGTRETAATPVIGGLEEAYARDIGDGPLTLTATVTVSDDGTVTTAWYETESNHTIVDKEDTAGTGLSITIPEPDDPLDEGEELEVYYVFVATNAVTGKTSRSARVEITITYTGVGDGGGLSFVAVTDIEITGGDWVAKPDPTAVAPNDTTSTTLLWVVNPQGPLGIGATNTTVVWALQEAVSPAESITINSATGEITVTKDATEGEVYLVATIIDGLGEGSNYVSPNNSLSFEIAEFGAIPKPEIHLEENPTGVGQTEYVGNVTKIRIAKPSSAPTVATHQFWYKKTAGSDTTVELTVLTGLTQWTADIVIDDNPSEVELVISAVMYDTATTDFGETHNLHITKAQLSTPSISLHDYVNDGEVTSNRYIIAPATTPSTIQVAGGANSPSGVTLLYSIDGSTPSLTYTLGTTTINPAPAPAIQTVVKAKATMTGWKDSEPAEETYYQAKVKTPAFDILDPAPTADVVDGGFTTVGSKFTIASTTGATIRYDFSATVPADKNANTGYTEGTTGVAIADGNLTITKTLLISAKAFKDGYIDSDGIATTDDTTNLAKFTQAQVKPVLFKVAGVEVGGAAGSAAAPVDFTDTTVELSCTTPAAVIKHTVAADITALGIASPAADGAAGDPVPVPLASFETPDGTAVIKATATKTGYQDSEELTKYYEHSTG